MIFTVFDVLRHNAVIICISTAICYIYISVENLSQAVKMVVQFGSVLCV